MSYDYSLLRPVRREGAATWNDPILTRPCLGIEVTEPELAARCMLGNLDPQHTDGRIDLSAIAVATQIPLPPEGTTLVTIRQDADALGAMAVLALRREGVVLGASALRRVAHIDRADRFARGPWPGIRPPPSTPEDIDEVGYGQEGQGAMAVHASSSAARIEDLVESFKRWIICGTVPHAAAEKARGAARELFEAIAAGHVTARTVKPGRVAYVLGSAPGALSLGYRLAPVVLAENWGDLGAASCRRRLVITQYGQGHADFRSIKQRLDRIEPGWGGSPTILGSPQGVACATPTETIRKIVLDSLLEVAPNSSNVLRVGPQ